MARRWGRRPGRDELCHNEARAEDGEPCLFTSRISVNGDPWRAMCSWCGRIGDSDEEAVVDDERPPSP